MIDDHSRSAKKAKAKRTAHWHGCTTCTDRYEDTCASAAIDGQCSTCRGLSSSRLLEDNRKPRDCCIARARLTTKEENKTYHLAGTRLWFICPVCSRPHPYDPKHQQPTRPIAAENALTWSFLTNTLIRAPKNAMPPTTSEKP